MGPWVTAAAWGTTTERPTTIDILLILSWVPRLPHHPLLQVRFPLFEAWNTDAEIVEPKMSSKAVIRFVVDSAAFGSCTRLVPSDVSDTAEVWAEYSCRRSRTLISESIGSTVVVVNVSLIHSCYGLFSFPWQWYSLKRGSKSRRWFNTHRKKDRLQERFNPDQPISTKEVLNPPIWTT